MKFSAQTISRGLRSLGLTDAEVVYGGVRISGEGRVWAFRPSSGGVVRLFGVKGANTSHVGRTWAVR